MKKTQKGSEIPRGEAWLAAKASHDKEFKKELLKEPKAVIERELGIKLDSDVKVVVVEDTAKVMHLVLPLKPEIPAITRIGGQLSDEELLAMLKKPIGYSFCPNENDNI